MEVRYYNGTVQQGEHWMVTHLKGSEEIQSAYSKNCHTEVHAVNPFLPGVLVRIQ